MDFDQGKRSGQIPAFGDWDNANELPITQYFESARQAGLVRYPYNTTNVRGYPADLYAADFQKPPIRLVGAPPRKTRARVNNNNNNGESNNNRRRHGCPPPPHVKEQQKQRILKQQIQPKVYDVVDVKQHLPKPRTRSQQLFYDNNNNQKQQFPKHSAGNVKPVDEDLYKIPPELLTHNSKRKRMLGFFSKCLVPPCNA